MTTWNVFHTNDEMGEMSLESEHMRVCWFLILIKSWFLTLRMSIAVFDLMIPTGIIATKPSLPCNRLILIKCGKVLI